MLRLRRFRVLLFFAFALIFGFYYLGKSDTWSTTSQLGSSLRSFGSNVGTTGDIEIKEKIGDELTLEKDAINQLPLDEATGPPDEMYQPVPAQPPPDDTQTPPSPPSRAESDDGEERFAQINIPPPPIEANDAEKQRVPTEPGEGEVITKPKPASEPARVPVHQEGTGAKEPPRRKGKTTYPSVHWTKLPEHYPVPTESVIALPTAAPKQIPRIQHNFAAESTGERRDRQDKQEQIKKAFLHSWNNYRKHAWMHDELRPVSGGFKDPFAGWGATLIDSLDTLWIMGLTEKFEEAVNATSTVDFTTSERSDIPLFEVTIRYLGGLIGAYDVSGQKYKVLKDKAVELGDVLLSAFDTPNRMPQTYFQWQPDYQSQPHKAGGHVVLAEIGTLTMEFIRLAQITKQNKYYDAVARITSAFYDWQNNTKLPGLFPIYVDTMGCKDAGSRARGSKGASPVTLLEEMAETHGKKPASAGKILPEQRGGRTDASVGTEDTREAAADQYSSDVDKYYPEPVTVGRGTNVETRDVNEESTHKLEKRQSHAQLPNRIGNEVDELCLNPSFSSNGFGTDTFTMGGMADSVYEYLPKSYLLLGGQNDEYRKMHEYVMDTMTEYLVYRPMIKDNDRDIRFTGALHTSGKMDARDRVSGTLDPSFGHLTCFVGALVGLGAKIFGRDEVDLATKLSDSCSWAYANTATGVMPEDITPIVCLSETNCPWNETEWLQRVDPSFALPTEDLGDDDADDVLADDDEAEEDSDIERSVPQVNGVNMDRDTLYKQSETNVRGPSGDTDVPESIDHGMPLPDHATQLDSPATDADVGDAPNNPEAQRSTTSGSRAAGVAADVGDVPNRPQARPPRAHAKRQLDDAHTISQQRQKDAAAGFAGDEDEDDRPAYEDADADEMMRNAPKIAQSSKVSSNEPKPGTREYAEQVAKDERVWPGITRVGGRNYILRPEAIESLFYMYRITGDQQWRTKAWDMFTAIERSARVKYGYSALNDVTSNPPGYLDTAESFWTAETLKYFYLTFSEVDRVSLDDWVFNTEAHPFLRPDASVTVV